MATFDFSGTLPQFKALIASGQLRNRYNDLKTHINTFNPAGFVLPSAASAAQYKALLMDSGLVNFSFSHVWRSNVAINHDAGNGSSGQLLQSDGDGTTSWVTAIPLTDGDKGDITVSSSGASWSIDNGVISAAKLASDSVTTVKVLDSNITTAKIADSNITTAKLASRAVTQSKIAFTTSTKTTTYTAVDRDYLLCDTSSAAFTVTLPASPTAGDWIVIVDLKGTFESKNLTLARNGSNIESVAQDLTINIKNFVGRFEYIDATIGWKRVG